MKFFKIYLIFAFLLFFSFSFVFAQDSSNLVRLRQEYYQANSNFKKELELFDLSRSKHLSYQSLASESEAINASQKMMASKVKLISSYLRLIREVLASQTKIENYQENLVYLKFDNLLTELSSFEPRIDSLQSLDDLQKVDQDMGDKFLIGAKLSYKSLGLVNLKKITAIFDQIEGQITALNKEINQFENLSSQDLGLLQKKVVEAETTFKNLKTELSQAEKLFLIKIETDEDKDAYIQLNRSLSTIKVRSDGLLINLNEIIK